MFCNMGGGVLASHSRFKKVLPVLLGNTLEAYDLCLYGLLAVYFSRVFLPQSNNSLTLAFLLFSIAYLARPIGSLLWGYCGMRDVFDCCGSIYVIKSTVV